MIQIKLIAVALAVVTIVTVAGLGYHHYTGVLSDLQMVQSALSLERVRSKEMTEARDSWQEQAEVLSKAAEDMAEVSIAAEEEVERLRDVQRKHDLGALAAEKPGLIQRRINDGTARVFMQFEQATGASGADR